MTDVKAIPDSPEMQQLHAEACRYLTPPHNPKAVKMALECLEAINDIESSRDVYDKIAVCHSLLSNNEFALKYFHLALADADTITDKKQLGGPYHNLGSFYYAIGDDDQALKYFRKAIEINPNNPATQVGISHSLLRKACSGQTDLFDEAWDQYEYRFMIFPPIKGKEGIIPWDGKPTDEVIVMVEQGIGDVFMFGRYISHLQKVVKKVYLQCEDEKVYPWAAGIFDIFRSIDVVPITSVTETECKTVISIGSLPRFFSGIPKGDWLKGYGKTHEFPKDTFNIGIVYSGNVKNGNDHNRTIPSSYFKSLTKYAKLYALTPWIRDNEYLTALNPKNWEETISYVNGLDLVISVDTSIVHLCGTLDKECWLLNLLKNTDYRWGNDSMGENTVWYNSVRVFRNPNDWSVVFQNVEKALQERLNK